MTAPARGLPKGLLAGLVLLIAGCATAYQHGQTALHEGRYPEAAAPFGENEADWSRDVIEARLAPHMYLGPAWFVRDPAGLSPLGWYPYGLPAP